MICAAVVSSYLPRIVAEWKVGREDHSLVVADLPGLIEGASQGKGLGAKFLKHVERTRSIIHCIDATADEETLIQNYRLIRNELAEWSTPLAGKTERIALTKIDLLSDEEKASKIAFLEKQTGAKVYPISSMARSGLTDLLTACI